MSLRRNGSPFGGRMVFPPLLSLLCVFSCTDLRDFSGSWGGHLARDPALRRGFDEDVVIERLILEEVSLDRVRITLSTSDGRFANASLAPVEGATVDALATLTFSGDPLRSYILVSSPGSEEHDQNTGSIAAVFILSVYPGDRMELRIIQGNDLYGLFYLERLP